MIFSLLKNITLNILKLRIKNIAIFQNISTQKNQYSLERMQGFFDISSD